MGQEPLPIAEEDQEVFLREHGAPRFVDAVTESKRSGSDLILSLDAFLWDPELLYVALDYATGRGIVVCVIPSEAFSLDSGEEECVA